MANRDGGGDDVVAREAFEGLTRDLRKYRPARVRAIVGGEPRDVAVPGSKRHRWETVAKLLLSLDWTRVELLDAKGALLHQVEVEVAAAEEEGDAPIDVEGLLGKPTGGLEREHGLIMLVLRAQQVVLKNREAEMALVTDGYRQIAESTFTRLERMEQMFDRTLQMAHDAAQRVASGGEGGEHDPNEEAVMKLIEKAMSGGEQAARFERLLGRAEKLFGAVAGPTPPTPKHTVKQEPSNGVKGG